MTNEEAITILDCERPYGSCGCGATDEEIEEALDMAIKALEQEPCEDAISRQAVLNILFYKSDNNNEVRLSKELRDRIKNLQSVKPQESKWIPVSERLPEQYEAVIVSDIETSDTYQSRYIGNGYWECDNGPFINRIIAWMPLPKPYEPQESEDKE